MSGPQREREYPPQPDADAAPAEPDLRGAQESAPQGISPQGISPEQLDALGHQLVWRIGRDDYSDEVVVRVGYASATGHFAALSRLRSVPDQELQQAAESGQIRVEWVE